MRKVTSRSIVAALALAVAFVPFATRADDDITGPPPGIKPTSVTLATVLRHHRLAIGTARATRRTEHWTLTFGSLSGTRDEYWQGDDYRVDTTRGPFHAAYGSIGGVAWHMNENGQVVREAGLHKRDEANERAYFSAGKGSRDVTLLGRVSKPVDAYVVRIDPPDGRLQFLFFSATTWQIVRSEEVRDGRRIVTTFDDFRTTSGLARPWHITIDDGHPNNVRDERLHDLTFAPVDPQKLVIPSDAPALFHVSAATAIPVKVLSDRIIIRAKIGTHTVNFQLDSGAAGIVIDRDVVHALGITEYGRTTGETAGSYVESDVVIPQMQIGTLTLSHVEARSLPFANMADASTPVAGLLGYDFIRNTVLHLDYQHGTLEALDPAQFTPPTGAARFAATFDDDVPVVHAAIGNARDLAFILDTGADRSLLFSSFVKAHPEAATDQGLGTEMRASFPFVDDFSGVGGEVAYQPLQVAAFHVGDWTFSRWLFDLTQSAPAFEGEDYDGLLGQDLLRNFDVYLDYPHGAVYFVPNDRYRDRWGT